MSFTRVSSDEFCDKNSSGTNHNVLSIYISTYSLIYRECLFISLTKIALSLLCHKLVVVFFLK